MSSEKVFCHDCIHLRSCDLEIFCIFEAFEEIDFSIGLKTIYARDRGRINKNGSCKDFGKQTSIWRRIFGPKLISGNVMVEVDRPNIVMAPPKDVKIHDSER